MRKSWLAALFLISAWPGGLLAQDLSALTQHLNRYRTLNLPEKVYVHTDKTFYLAGEILWFRMDAFDGVLNKPLSMSRVGYVEVLDKDQKPVLQGKVELDSARGEGSFFLPLSLASGNYQLRGYTNWMKNFSPDFFFHKTITIVNTLKRLSDNSHTNTGPALSIQFFPEGGQLVSGINSKIGFKISNTQGRGVDQVEGSLLDQNNQEVAHFTPLKFGMGSFSFTPLAGMHYSAVLKAGANSAVVAEFPQAKEQGYVMTLRDPGGADLEISIQASPQIGNARVFLFSHTRAVVKQAEESALQEGKAVFHVSKEKLGEGISHLTLFDSYLRPLSERLYFKRPTALSFDVQTPSTEYGTRQKVTLHVRTQDPARHLIPSNFSASVFLLDSLTSSEAGNLLTYLWLNSDIRGEIEHPQYYFDSTNKDLTEVTDNLMLTQGWRRFRWEDINDTKGSAKEYLPEIEGHLIHGKVLSKLTGRPTEGITTFVSAPGVHFELGSSVSNAEGQVEFSLRNFYGSNEIVLQPASIKDTGNRFEISSPFSEKYREGMIPPFSLPETQQQDLLQHSVATQVQNAFFPEHLQSFRTEISADSTAFYGQPDKRYYLDDYTRFNTMEEVLREYVEYITVHKRQKQFYFKVLDDRHHTFFEEPPLMLMDGVVVLDANSLMNYDPLKVKKIEVVSRQYYLGSAILNGIISWFSYKGDLENFQIDPSSVVLEYEGMQLKREFYQPKYETPEQVRSRTPDFRSLLYWSGSLSTDKDGYKQLNFYSSDRPGNYLVLLQGVSQQGQVGATTFTFGVSNP